MKLRILQDFNAGADYKTGDTVDADDRNAETWIARGYALPEDEAPAPAPEKKTRVVRKKKAAAKTDEI